MKLIHGHWCPFMKVSSAAFIDLLPSCADCEDLELGGGVLSTISPLSLESSTQRTARTLEEVLGECMVGVCMYISMGASQRSSQ